ncbi:hypothetical protein EJB05_34663 [Eragrostis curvula]|uniref:CRAL-TRIO domain-containing protein n=1 Tax=Eragrostis curvula TaxID=38414 RepID=A0A5J9U4Z5_9POAL|nr:hypothetical protein EJB05_34663 [Eragrostis curvula]
MASYLFRSKSEPARQNLPSPEEQQRKINEVREMLGVLTTEMPGFLTDSTIRRFLRVKNWNTVQATKALKETVKWRRQYQPEKIRWEDISESENEAKRAYIADYRDKNGRTVYISKPSVKSLTSTKERIKQAVYNLEILAMDTEGTQEDHVVWLMDFRGWTPSETPIGESRESLHILQNYYPGLIAVAVILKHFVEPTMKERIKFVYSSSPDSQRIMSDLFDLDKLDSAFGGRNTAGLDVIKYGERMRARDQIRGACTHGNGNASSS